VTRTEPHSPLVDWDWLQRNRERVNQLEIPGADVDPDRRALDLLGQHYALEHQRKMKDLEVEREAFRLQTDKRVERQESALGWIQVSAVALIVPALVLVTVLVALGETEPWVLAPLLTAACGGAAIPLIKLKNRLDLSSSAG